MKTLFSENKLNLYYAGPKNGACDFEHGTCHWNNSAVSDMPWYLREGSTHSQHTGPAVDHTKGTPQGNYLVTGRRLHSLKFGPNIIVTFIMLL